MQSITNMIRKNVASFQLLLLAGGFVVMLGELILLNHTDGIQLVAVASTAVGVLLALWGLAAKGRMRNALAVLFLLLSITGLIGTFEHLEGEEEGEAAVRAQMGKADSSAVVNVSFNAEEDDEAGEAGENAAAEDAERERSEHEGAEEGEATPPPLAPLSLSGLALFGAVTVLGNKQEE